MLFWRFLIALPFFALILALTRSFPQKKAAFTQAVALGFVCIGIEASLYFLTIEHLGASLTAVIFYLYPAFVAIFSTLFLKEKQSVLRWGCIALSLVGCVLAMNLYPGLGPKVAAIPDPSPKPAIDLPGICFGLLTAICYAGYLLLGSRISKNENPLTVSAGISLGSFFAFTLLTLIELPAKLAVTLPTPSSFDWGGIKIPHTVIEVFAILGMAVIATVLPFSTLYAGMRKVGATRAALLSTLEMVFTIILAACFFGEKLTLVQGGGAFLILLSVLLLQTLR